MAIRHWSPRQELSRQEQFLMKRLDRTRKLFGFLRAHRHELFDEQFEKELESMYRDSGAGKEPNPPAMMAMALLLQSYVGASDAEAVELTVVDLRWQMVLDRLRAAEPAFSQGSIAAFRDRLIEHDMDRRLLERTVELAKRTREFDWRKLPKYLHLAIDSSPLEGAGRVEDTINLLGHAARKVVACAAALVGRSLEQVASEAGIPVLLGSSIKEALDVQWSDPGQKEAALQEFVSQLDSLERWLLQQLPAESAKPPLREAVDVLRQLRAQDLEPDPGGGGARIREGVAPDRRVSVEDPEMRHGRKSKSKLFNGYKRHLAVDVDSGLILAGAVTPANRPEEAALPTLEEDLVAHGRPLATLYIDRGYLSSPLVERTVAAGGDVVCRPWVARNGELLSKEDFRHRPAGHDHHLSGRGNGANPSRFRGAVFRRSLRSLPAARALHRCGAGQRPHGLHRIRRAPPAASARGLGNRRRAPALAHPHQRRTPARPSRTPTGPSSSLSRCAQEPLRRPPRQLGPKPRNGPQAINRNREDSE